MSLNEKCITLKSSANRATQVDIIRKLEIAASLMTAQITCENHYVPQSYLKRWAGLDGKIWTSRLLVPDERMPLWKLASARGIAKHQNLYTRIAAGRDTDEIERWLNEEFETPAQASIEKAIADERLSPQDWRQIIRFVAAQDVRTPATLHESMKRWETDLQTTIEEILAETVSKFSEAKQSGVAVETSPYPHAEYFPIRTTIELLPGAEHGHLGVEMIAGRGLWLFSLRHLLTKTLQVLFTHRWTILKCPDGMRWLTSDDPVVKLNYNSPKSYDFLGGWGSVGTEIYMPLGPRHLLYTRIGHRPPDRGTVLSFELANCFQRFTVENAHRFVYSTYQDDRLPELRRRHVSAEAFESEAKQWKNWHAQQTKAEQDLLVS